MAALAVDVAGKWLMTLPGATRCRYRETLTTLARLTITMTLDAHGLRETVRNLERLPRRSAATSCGSSTAWAGRHERRGRVRVLRLHPMHNLWSFRGPADFR